MSWAYTDSERLIEEGLSRKKQGEEEEEEDQGSLFCELFFPLTEPRGLPGLCKGKKQLAKPVPWLQELLLTGLLQEPTWEATTLLGQQYGLKTLVGWLQNRFRAMKKKRKIIGFGLPQKIGQKNSRKMGK